jgi:HD-GYP domain-containing protein (c-di-GMP phosphodiesterase class II)
MKWTELSLDWKDVTKGLMETLKQRDPYTYGHCQRVAELGRNLALAAGLSETEALEVQYAALFHDLGKIGIPDRVLLKPDRLTAEEASIMRLHPIKSVEILQSLTRSPFIQALIPAVRAHHERMDGQGYPFGLKGDEIPLAARILLIVDTFDAMTTDRPYRKGKPVNFAYRELRTFAGRQFDIHLVRVFLQSHKHWKAFDPTITEAFVARYYPRAA